MIKFLQYISFLALAGLLTGCSQVLQTVDLTVNTEDSLLQEDFNVVEKTLTLSEAKAHKSAPYFRAVLRNGRGEIAQPIPEKIALKSEFPKGQSPQEYKIGIGDTLTYLRLIDNIQNLSDENKKWQPQQSLAKYKLGIGDTLTLTLINNQISAEQLPSNTSEDNQNPTISYRQEDVTINSTGRVGSDGSVLLLEVGRLEASGKSLSELRSEVRNIFIRNGTSPRFQLEITEFLSQRAYLTISSTQGKASRIINLNDQRTTLLDILTSAGISYTPGIITTVKLRRNNDILYMKLRDIFSKGSPQIHILDRDHIFVEENLAELETSLSTVDKSGNVVFTGVGKIKALGRSLSELQNEIEKLLEKVPNSQNAFQIQITNFGSQKALLKTPGKLGVVIPITSTPVKLSEALTQNGVSVDANSITQISLQRDGRTYEFSLDDLLALGGPDIYLQPDDHISAQVLPYKENKVFIVGGVSPQIFMINPANRETLADVLFTSGGPLGSSSAKRSEVYLLRGSNPVVAFHLDAQSPTRLIVADAMELRPNDILYVAEQPIISFNRTLATIVPLRILLRDLQDENIP